MDEKNKATLEEVRKRIKDGGNGGPAGIDGLRLKVTLSSEDTEALKKEAKERSESVFSSATDYYNLVAQIRILESIPDIDLFPEKIKKIGELKNEKVRIDTFLLGQPKPIQDQFFINLLIVEINNIIPTSDEEVVRYFKKILAMGRGRVPNYNELNKIKTGQMPSSEIVYFRSTDGSRHNLLHVPSKLSGREGQISGADKKLFAALRGLVQRRIVARSENLRREIDDLSVKGNHDLFGIKKGVLGIYFLYMPDFKGKSGVEEGPGGGLVRVYERKGKEKPFTVIETIKGVGSLSFLNQEKPIFIPVHSLDYFLNREKLPESISLDLRDFVREFFIKLKRAVRWCAEQRDKARQTTEA